MKNRTTFSVSFYQRTDKVDKKNTVPIYMRVTVNGQRAEIATNKRFDIKRWAQGHVSGTKKDAKGLRNDLDSMKSRVNEIYRDMSDRHEEITVAKIKARFTGSDKKPIIQYWEPPRNNEMKFEED
jgi:hypothetical protein